MSKSGASTPPAKPKTLSPAEKKEELDKKYEAIAEQGVVSRALTRKIFEKNPGRYRGPSALFDAKRMASVDDVFTKLTASLDTVVLPTGSPSIDAIQALRVQLNGEQKTPTAGARQLATAIAPAVLEGYTDDYKATTAAFEGQCARVNAAYERALAALKTEKEKEAKEAKAKEVKEPGTPPGLKIVADAKAAADAYTALEALKTQMADLRNTVLEQEAVELERFQKAQIEEKKAQLFRAPFASEVDTAQFRWRHDDPAIQNEIKSSLGRGGVPELKEGPYSNPGYSFGIRISKDAKTGKFSGTLDPPPSDSAFKFAFWQLHLKMNPQGLETTPLKLGPPGAQGGETPEEVQKLMQQAYNGRSPTGTEDIYKQVLAVIELAEEHDLPVDVNAHLQFLHSRRVEGGFGHWLSSALGEDNNYYTYDMHKALEQRVREHNAYVKGLEEKKMDEMVNPERKRVQEEARYFKDLASPPGKLVGATEADSLAASVGGTERKRAESDTADEVEEKKSIPAPEEIAKNMKKNIADEIKEIEGVIEKVQAAEVKARSDIAGVADFKDAQQLVDGVHTAPLRQGLYKEAKQRFEQFQKHNSWLKDKKDCPADVKASYAALEKRVKKVLDSDRLIDTCDRMEQGQLRELQRQELARLRQEARKEKAAERDRLIAGEGPGSVSMRSHQSSGPRM